MISGRLQQLLGSNIYTSGLAYSRQRRVLDFHHEADGTLVSSVRGSSPTPYRQSIKVRLGKDGKIGAVAGRCSCPMTYNCKHVAAVLISAAVEPVAAVAVAPAPVLSPLLAGWLSRVRAADQAAPEADSGYPEDTTERLVYVLGEEPRGKLSATPMRVSLRKDGTFNKTLRRYNPHGYGSATHNAPAFVRPEDLPIMRLLDRLGLNPASYPGTVAKPESGEIMRVLESIAATGRGYWQDQFGPPLKLGLQRSGRFAWRALADGQQVLEIQDDTGAALQPLPIDPPGWIDSATGGFGALSLDGPAALVRAICKRPQVPINTPCY